MSARQATGYPKGSTYKSQCSRAEVEARLWRMDRDGDIDRATKIVDCMLDNETTIFRPEQLQAAFPDDDDHEWLRKKEAETTVTVLLDKLAAAGIIRSKVIGDGSVYWLFQQDRIKQMEERERAAAAQTVAIINETKAVEVQIAAAFAALQDPLSADNVQEELSLSEQLAAAREACKRMDEYEEMKRMYKEREALITAYEASIRLIKAHVIQHHDTAASAVCDWLKIDHKYGRDLPRIKHHAGEEENDVERMSHRARIEEVRGDVDVVVDEVNGKV